MNAAWAACDSQTSNTTKPPGFSPPAWNTSPAGQSPCPVSGSIPSRPFRPRTRACRCRRTPGSVLVPWQWPPTRGWTGERARRLRLDEDHEGLGQHAVVGHRLARLRLLHGGHHDVHVGHVHQHPDAVRVLGVDERPDVRDSKGTKNSSRLGRREPVGGDPSPRGAPSRWACGSSRRVSGGLAWVSGRTAADGYSGSSCPGRSGSRATARVARPRARRRPRAGRRRGTARGARARKYAAVLLSVRRVRTPGASSTSGR